MPPGEGENDPTGTGAGTGEGEGEGEGGAGNGGTEGGSGGTGEGTPEKFDEARAMATIRTLRESEKQLKTRATTAEKRAKELEDAKKSESEKLQEELETLRARDAEHTKESRSRVTRESFVTAAQKAGALKPDALFKLADGLELDEDGKPTNTSSVLKDLREQYPELFGGGSADGGAGRGQGTKTKSFSDMIRESRGARAGR